MSKRVDFDAIREEPIEAKFNGRWYKLPADCPIEILAALEGADDSDANTNEFAILREQVTKLFQVYQPELTAPPCGMRELFDIIPKVYWAAEAKPTRTTSRGGRKKPTSSRSSPARRSGS